MDAAAELALLLERELLSGESGTAAAGLSKTNEPFFNASMEPLKKHIIPWISSTVLFTSWRIDAIVLVMQLRHSSWTSVCNERRRDTASRETQFSSSSGLRFITPHDEPATETIARTKSEEGSMCCSGPRSDRNTLHLYREGKSDLDSDVSRSTMKGELLSEDESTQIPTAEKRSAIHCRSFPSSLDEASVLEAIITILSHCDMYW
mmetsp:Transcript_36487/g.88060  ORF Transcript_36487/g.88060 Transcript_36487/m.88060 type:complete len:206 (-) Transcript_36487:6995-7612(-)